MPKKAIKYILFSLIPLLALALATELGLRVVHFQRHSDYTLALISAYHYVQEVYLRELAMARVHKLAPLKKMEKALYRPEGAEVLAQFQKEYENHFETLLSEVKKADSEFLMLYLPMANYRSAQKAPEREAHRSFYSGLAARHGVAFVDMSGEFMKQPVDAVTLLPLNGHLSRYGNRLIALTLAEALKACKGHRSKISYQGCPDVLGDLKPNSDEIWNIIPAMPYRVVVNRQGLRMNFDLAFPKPKPRVLILGDSYTFGPYVANQWTYPGFLQDIIKDFEVINAGKSGFTITDEASLFIHKAKYAEPDITVLQVLDNDISGLFFKRNQYDRKGRVFEPTPAEKRLMAKISEGE